ncbi:hypothetical protein PHISP_00821 [Aspergillus sp. HF37]|nr:hypothetical protein PHISP_00821 [Aspergillus sp. HF37]
MSGSKIACIGVIGKDDDPLHISLFPPYEDSTVEFSFLLNSCLDIFDIRQKQTSIDQDLGLLHAVDERLAAYGWLTNTGIKFIIVMDLVEQPAPIGNKEPKNSAVAGLRDSDLKPVFQALQTAYVQLLQNPFYSPDDRAPIARAATPTASMGLKTKFATEIKRIGNVWSSGT